MKAPMTPYRSPDQVPVWLIVHRVRAMPDIRGVRIYGEGWRWAVCQRWDQEAQVIAGDVVPTWFKAMAEGLDVLEFWYRLRDQQRANMARRRDGS